MNDTHAPGLAPLLSELIEIPERVQTNDFVLKLADGVSADNADATIRNYVVTPQLAIAFDRALGIIKGAMESRQSAACYLHGSFGSGKSHFMAVLNLLLAGNIRARAVVELAGCVTRHDGWMAGKSFLMVPFHMIGANSLESAILGGYAEHVRRVHPGAPIPGFYLGEKLFADAGRLRAGMGDGAFLAALNAGAEAAAGWGDLAAAWSVASFDAAVAQAPESPERQRLVGRLIETFFGSYGDVVAGSGEAFVDLDTGLSIMSHHAQALGYDGVVLFLDELILWLASMAADVGFLASEGAKLSKLVEAQHANRPIPIVSFVARQRDLRELVGDSQAGAVQVQMTTTLNYWQARFDTVTLEDRNLPVIAERRILRPKTEAARQLIDGAFEDFAGRNRAVLDTLLGPDGDRALFRKTYPFSPALVQALIAASSVLQRERTALKLMVTLLVKRRGELRLGSLIPVGDLWDEIATGDQPFSDGMRIQFENARRLWTQKLLPLLEQEHNVSWPDLQEGVVDKQVVRRFDNDARLLKTLLLAALVPEVPALRALTAPRLAALNHGSVVTPIAGQQGGLVLQKLRGWAARVGEIRISEDQIPVVSLQITGVDLAPILENAAPADNDGARKTRLRKILFELLEVAQAEGPLLNAQPFTAYEHPWRGTRRAVDLYFEVVKDLSDERLRGRAEVPVLVLGMPFDPRPPMDHVARVRNAGDSQAGGVVWQPSYLGERALRDLGTLLRIDFLLAGDRMAEAARMLSATEREQARALLRSQSSALHQRLRTCVEAAYGIRPDTDGCLGAMLEAEDRLVPLGSFQPRMPVAASLKETLRLLLDSLFADRAPAHPVFEQEVRPAVLQRVLDRVAQAAQMPEQRLDQVEAGDRLPLRAIAGPLQLGQMGQSHFYLIGHWADHFSRMQALAGADTPWTAGRLRGWIDQPKPMGLTAEVQNLVILAFAAQADRTPMRGGVAAPVSLARIDDAV